jgi:endo-1,3-1,4-beta-glycanase ExoK
VVAAAAHLLAAAAIASLSPGSTARDQSGFFFEDFNHFDGRRWYISDGWANGPWQGCAWSRRNVALKAGILTLKLTPTRNRLRDYQCAELQSRSRFGYGTYEGRIRAARGSGIVSALFTYSGRPATSIHDELDFEVLGRDTRTVETNYFVKGQSLGGRRASLGKDGASEFTTFAVEWRPTGLRWFVDGRPVRTDSKVAVPSTPGKIYLSIWNVAAGQQDWGGRTDRRALPASVEYDWIAFTPAGQNCLFPQSITCKR